MTKYFLACFICFCSSIRAQTFDASKMDSLFKLIDTKNKGMGNFSIFANGEEIYQKSFGFSDVSNNKRANSYTTYRIGSVSKTFTATIIMLLIEEGKINLNTVLSKYFPKIPNSNKITIENLLNHQSGLFNLTDDENLSDWMTEPQSRKKMIERIIAHGTVFEPKENTQYSNTNYILLSYIAEIIDNKKFQNILETRIIKPLNLNRTEFGKKIDPANNEALPYDFENSDWKLNTTHTDMSLPMGAGGMVSTPTELNVFYKNLFTDHLVSAYSLAKMKNAQEGMGLGLMKLPLGDKEVYGHGGSIDGFQSFVAYFPKEKVSFAITTNNLYTQVSNILIGTVQIYFGMEYKLPDFSPITAIQLNTEELNPYLGKYSSPSFPIDITITKDGNTLIAQGENQSSFAIDAIGKDTFHSENVMITLKFIPGEKKMMVEQGGQTFVLTKE
ncbi:beta-lactamase family protein [Gelidibacter salicanalis]|uniref:Beta-lactamase family protein n=2 Tax=Gelidibacter salicanalis TaxID=291193 RepID=A0A5C7AJP3_9FLAO|nr:beta-lactamase family protein [Gelidibacter salicanalis]